MRKLSTGQEWNLEDEMIAFNDNHKYVELHSMEDFRTGQRKKVKINWSAIGTVDIATTQKFINNLRKAVLKAKQLNKKYNL